MALRNLSRWPELQQLLWAAVLTVLLETALPGATVTLAWDPSPAPNVAGYNLHYGVVSGHYTNKFTLGGITSATITGLQSAVTYFVAVRAYDSNGLEGESSNEISFTVPGGSGGSIPPYDVFRSARGSYYGLFFEEDQVRQHSAGSFSLSLTARGAFSGSLRIGAAHYPFSGRLDTQGEAVVSVRQPRVPPLTLQLRLGQGADTDRILGNLSAGNGAWAAVLMGERSASSSAEEPNQRAGAYTWHIPGQTGTASLPAGDSFGLVRLNAQGHVCLAGHLADATPITQGAFLSVHGLWPLYVPLYSGKGSVLCWATFSGAGTQSIEGPLNWIKPARHGARYYPGGFTNQNHIFGSSYVPARNAADALDRTGAAVAFAGGNLALTFTNLVSLGQGNRTANPDPNRLGLHFSQATGIFHGWVLEPCQSRLFRFHGVVIQQSNTGHGFLLGPSQTSCVTVSAQP